MHPSRLHALFFSLLLAGCDSGKSARSFKLLGPDQTGVTFANTITTDDSVNVQTDVYVYNGAGVAVGDIDNDGLPDIFFSGNMVSSRLYLNKGNMRFDDITERAGVTTQFDGPPALRWWTSMPTGIWISTSRFPGPNGPSRINGRTCCSSTTEIERSRKPRRDTVSRIRALPRTPFFWITTGTDASISFCSTIRPRIFRAVR